jgi:hypothetical protein
MRREEGGFGDERPGSVVCGGALDCGTNCECELCFLTLYFSGAIATFKTPVAYEH